MSAGNDNPPLPGQGITPATSPESARPFFAQAQTVSPAPLPPAPPATTQTRPPETPALKLEMRGPDGTAIRQGVIEDKRQEALARRMGLATQGLEKDGGRPRDPAELRHEFKNAHDHDR